MTSQSLVSPHLRPATVRLVGKLLAPLIDSGTVTANEYDSILSALKALARNEGSPVPFRLITGQEAAEMLGISFSQFRALEKEGAFPFVRKMVGGKTVRYRNHDIYRYMLRCDSQMNMSPGAGDAV